MWYCRRPATLCSTMRALSSGETVANRFSVPQASQRTLLSLNSSSFPQLIHGACASAGPTNELHDTRRTREILDDPDGAANSVRKQPADRVGLRRIALEQRDAARREHAREIRHRAADEIETIAAGDDGGPRFVLEGRALASQLRECVVAQIRQVRADDVD